MRKKILFIHHSSGIGGGSFCLLNLLREVDLNRFEPMVLLKDDGPLVAEIRKLEISVHLMHSLFTVPYNRPLLVPESLHTYMGIYCSKKDFRSILKSLNPDIVYFNNSMLYPYMAICKEFGIRTIIHIREHWPLTEHRMQLKWFQKGIAENSDHIVAINQYSAGMIPGVEHKMSIVYDWIDFKERDVKYNLSELMGEDVTGKKVFLYTGGMQHIKGVCEVLETFSKICGDDCRLLSLGTYPPELTGIKGKIKVFLNRLGYKVASVRVFEALNKDSRIVSVPSIYEIKNIIEQCYCLLSYFTIPHANLVLAESIILNKPIVAVRTHESEEYSLGGELAMLCTHGDIKEFESIISDLDKNIPDLLNRLTDKSNIIAQKFDRSTNAKLFRQVLERCLSE
jgi:glycosyltransferase involved in cell wall biosynthesis